MTVFSPRVTPTIYDRGKERYGSEVRKMEYDGWRLVESNVAEADNVCPFGDGMVMFRDEIGDVFIGDGHAHVSDGMYRSHPVMFIQEHVASAIMYCMREGVVDSVDCTNERCVYKESE